MRFGRLLLIFILSGSQIISCKRTAGTTYDVPYSDGMGYVKSINGEIVYHFDPKTSELRMVQSFKNLKSGYYLTRLKNDTLELGEDFIGEVIFMREGTLHLTSPLDTLYKTTKGTQGYYKAKVPTSNLGTYEFSGKMKFDTEEYSFLYKYIVVEKGQRKNKFVLIGKVPGGRDPD